MQGKACCATTMAIALLLVGALDARAVVGVQINGATLALYGSDGADQPRLRYYNAEPGGPGYTEIFDDDGVNDPLPETCGRPDFGGAPDPDFALCEDGGTAPYLAGVQMTLYGGGDEPNLQACFDETVIDAGEGTNRIVAPDCGGGTLSVSSGAGPDTFWGPNSADSPYLIAMSADLGAGDDTFDSRGGGGAASIHGGPGDDYLVGGAGDQQLFGDDGEDWFLGHGGNDSYDGGPGDDRFGQTKGVSNDDDPGNDDYRGGAGADLLILDGHASGMTISLDETANDGSAGEADNVHNDIETIRGTKHADAFTGGPGADRFEGESGADTIHGADGADALVGGGGDDRLYGDAGADKVEGSQGADTVDGGPGADQLYGDISGCSVFCSFDSDVLLARDGEADTVDCGGGADSAQVDASDVVAFCATVDRQAAPAGGGSGPGGSAGAATFGFTAAATASMTRGVGATVTCPAACTFTVSVVIAARTARRYGLGRRALSIGRARGTLLAAGSKKVTVRLSRRARRKLRRARRVPATLKVSVEDSSGTASAATKAIRLGR